MQDQTLPSTRPRRWTPKEDNQLKHLRFTEGKTWREIAAVLDRTLQAVQGHYHNLQNAHHSSFEDWDATMDAQIVDGRRRGLRTREIGAEMGLPGEAVQGRWYELQQQRKVPEEVLAIWRRKGEVVWAEEEDVAILKAWVDGKNDDEIVQTVKFKGKCERDVRKRRKQLCRERGLVYSRMMGMTRDQPAPGGLENALGKDKFAWMS